MSDEQYRNLDADGRAIVRCFVGFEYLPPAALTDMRSLSIQGSSLARQIVDEDAGGVASPSSSALEVATRMIAFGERGE